MIVRKVDMSENRQRRQAPQQGTYRHANPQARPPQGAYRPASAQPGAYRPATARHAAHQPVPSSGGYRPQRPFAQPPKKKGGPWRAVFWVALVVFVLALAALGLIGFSYWQGQQTYNDIAEQGFNPPSDIEGTSLADLTVDWDALKAVNPDTVGWIYIPGTPVNYPVVHTTDNDKYLTRDFKGSEGWIATFGAIFLAAENKGDFTDANNIVYGHHLNDGSMFACIADFEDKAKFGEHRTAYLLTPQGNYRLTTVSLVHVAADDPLAQTSFADEDERVAYVQDKIDRSVVKPADIPQAADMAQTFAFATCDNLPTDGRYVLYAYVADSTVGNAPEGDADAPAGDAQGDLADPDAVDAVGDAAEEAAA